MSAKARNVPRPINKAGTWGLWCHHKSRKLKSAKNIDEQCKKKVTKVDEITPVFTGNQAIHRATRDSIASPCALIAADLGHSKATRLLDATDAKITMLENVPHFEEHVRSYLSDHLGPCLQNCRSAVRGSRYTVDSLNYCRLGPFESQLAATHDVQGDATVTASTTVRTACQKITHLPRGPSDDT